MASIFGFGFGFGFADWVMVNPNNDLRKPRS
jgi:hypothetical protein